MTFRKFGLSPPAAPSLAAQQEGAGGSGKERQYHDYPQQVQHENGVPPKSISSCPRVSPAEAVARFYPPQAAHLTVDLM
jgi:hypothetical protein